MKKVLRIIFIILLILLLLSFIIKIFSLMGNTDTSSEVIDNIRLNFKQIIF